MNINFLKKHIIRTLLIGITIGLTFNVAIAYYHVFSTLEGLVHSGSEVLGGDFVCFYLAGKLFNSGLSPYDQQLLIDAQQDFLNSTLIQNPRLVFAYPPFMLPLFGALARFEYIDSLAIWCGISVLCLIISIVLLTPKQSPYYVYVILILMAFAYTPFSIRCLPGGQLSSFGVLIWSLFFFALRNNKIFIAGFLLGFGMYKPPLFAIIGLLIILKRQWRILGGVLLSSLILLIISIVVLSPIGWESYLATISSYHLAATLPDGRVFIQPHPVGLLGCLMALLPSNNLAIIIYFAAVALFLLLNVKLLPANINKHSDFSLISILIASTLLSIQVVNYDLSILFAGILLIGGFCATRDTVDSELRLLVSIFIMIIGNMAANPEQDTAITFSLISSLLIASFLPMFWAKNGTRGPEYV